MEHAWASTVDSLERPDIQVSLSCITAAAMKSTSSKSKPRVWLYDEKLSHIPHLIQEGLSSMEITTRLEEGQFAT